MSEGNQNSRILIVDDTIKNIQVLGTVLKQEGYNINVAQNGQQALDVVQKVAPDLILLDVMMPVMDGFEACKLLKENPETREIPVVFLTAKVETDDIVKGFELGAVDYVTKPFNTTELLVRVDTHLSLHHLRRRLEQLVEERTAQLAHRVRELDGRDRLLHLQMSGGSVAEVYEAVVTVAEEALGAQKVAVYRPDEAESSLTLVAGKGLSEPGVIQTGEQLAGEEAVDLGGQSEVALTYTDQKPRTGEDDQAVVPVIYGDRVLGVLWVDTLALGALDRESELDSLWRIGQEAALAIHSAEVAADLDAGEIDVADLLNVDIGV